MSKKSNLVTPSGGILTPSSLIPDDSHYTKVPEVKGARPTGSLIMVELLTAQELANTRITITEKTDMKVPMQGYVRAAGPSFKTEDWGFKVGDRVLISTQTAVIAPKYDDCHRDRFFMDPQSVRGVIEE